jgi:hypothetical protein
MYCPFLYEQQIEELIPEWWEEADLLEQVSDIDESGRSRIEKRQGNETSVA